jgi:DeoR/GlpR family transcriptional regulator of sugar metabolism
VRTPSDALVGPFAVSALRSVNLDLVFLGVHGMDDHAGFTSPNLQEAETDQALLEAGRRLVVVADHTKWGIIGLSSIARLDQADALVTDSHVTREAREILEARVRELIVVEPRAVEPRVVGTYSAADPAGGRRSGPEPAPLRLAGAEKRG